MQNRDIYTKERQRNIAYIGRFRTHARTPGVNKEQLIDVLSSIGIVLLVAVLLAL